MPSETPLETVKSILDYVKSKPEDTEKGQTRAGPLVVAGRLYVSLTLILAFCASSGAYVDLKTERKLSSGIECMRTSLVIVVFIGLASAIGLILVLYRRNHLLLFSPTELSTEAQQSMLGPKTQTVIAQAENLIVNNNMGPNI